MPAGDDDEILLSVLLICHRRRLPAGRKLGLPDDLARFDIDGAHQILGRRRDEDQSTGGHDGPAVVGVSMRGGNIEGMPNGPACLTIQPYATPALPVAS